MRTLSLIALALVLVSAIAHPQQATPPAEAPLPFDKWQKNGINPPKVLNSVAAEFSDEARRKGVSGICVVSLEVDAAGMPQNIQIVRCTDPSFEENSLKAVAQYKFRPATTQEGQPIAVTIHVEVSFRLYGFRGEKHQAMPIRFEFSAPPGSTSSEPDAGGVYPLSKSATPPSVVKFSDKEYGDAAFAFSGKSACDMLITISTKGKASDPQVIHCESPALERAAIDSLLRTKYLPGSLNGKAVPMRASIHLEYGDVPPKP